MFFYWIPTIYISFLAVCNGYKKIPQMHNMKKTAHQSKIAEFNTGIYTSRVNNRGVQSSQENDGDLDYEGTSPLARDIKYLSDLLAETIKKESSTVFELYTKFRAHALARSHGDKAALGKMIRCAEDISDENALGVTRAFTQTLNLINAAEVHDAVRSLALTVGESQSPSPLPKIEDSVSGTIDKILSWKADVESDKAKDEIFEALKNQRVEIVFTAHPTEVNRRTLLKKYRSISEILASRDREGTSPYEKKQTDIALRRQVASIWGSDEIRRNKPTPQQEASGGLAIIESVLWDAVPSYLRKLHNQVEESTGRSLPIDFTPIRFASWMGGDRDGNGFVTPTVTHEVSKRQRHQAARLLREDMKELYAELAICKGFSEDMKIISAEVKISNDVFERYRRVIGHIIKRLDVTMVWLEKELESRGSGLSMLNVDPNDAALYPLIGPPSKPYRQVDELKKPLMIMYESLVQGGYKDVADGLLLDIIRRVSTFGLSLVPLDIRQESGRHREAVDAITKYLDLGSYNEWDEERRIEFLMTEIFSKRPLIKTSEVRNLGFSETVVDTLETFQMASELGPGSLGAYVISQTTSASDILSVILLQKMFGLTADNGKLLRVVPLFETLADLTNSPKIMESLFAMPRYLELIKYKHEIMIGYSDSAKDAGRIAACWIQYESQEKMVQVAEKFGVDLTFFHGKGGTVGRGGNPALYRAVIAHPPRTINGKFRVTEQGEMITQNFGSAGRAERTIDIYTAAVLAEKFIKHVEPRPSWRSLMDEISRVSCQGYKNLVFEQARFIKYFRQATPELELGSLNIGSRPAKRNPKGGIESLRAIPWTFAWTQTRLNLPAWFGVEQGFDSKGDEGRLTSLREMYGLWPFFREMVDLIAMTLSKSDSELSKMYEEKLVCSDDISEMKQLGQEIRQSLAKTTENVLKITECPDLSNNFESLHRSMIVRYPYIDPLNALQAEILKRYRNVCSRQEELKSKTGYETELAQLNERRKLLEDTLALSINGIAQGMKNSG